MSMKEKMHTGELICQMMKNQNIMLVCCSGDNIY